MRTVTVDYATLVEGADGTVREVVYEAEVDVWPRTGGFPSWEPPDGGPELQTLRADGIIVPYQYHKGYEDIIARLEERAEEIVLEEGYGDGREL